MASIAEFLTKSGPSKSGKPCARLIASCSTASRVISVKMVVPNPRTLAAPLMAGRAYLPCRAGSHILPAPTFERHAFEEVPLPHRDHRVRPRRLDRGALLRARGPRTARDRGPAARRPA